MRRSPSTRNEVRECAFRCLDMFTDLLKRFSVRVDEQGAENAAAAHKNDAEKVASKANAGAKSGGVGGALAWAVNAAAKRVGGGPPVDEDALAGRARRPEEEAAARGSDMSAKSFGSRRAAVPRLYGEAYTPTSTPGTTPAKGGPPGGGGGGGARTWCGRVVRA